MADKEPAGHFVVVAGKIRAISSVVTAIVIAIGLIVMAAILARGTYWSYEGCVNEGSGNTENKLGESDMSVDVQMMDGGQIYKQPVQYNHDSNTMTIFAANFSGKGAATIVADYNRRLLFISPSGQNKCVAGSLFSDMSDAMRNFMRQSTTQVVDIATARISTVTFQVGDEIPSGYVQLTNGPIVNGLCSGRSSHWSEVGMPRDQRRRKRLFSFSGRVCIFVCFDLDIQF